MDKNWIHLPTLTFLLLKKRRTENRTEQERVSNHAESIITTPQCSHRTPGLAQSTSLWLDCLLFVPAPFWCALSPSHGSAWCVCQWPPIRQRRRFWSSSRWWKVWVYSYPTLPSLLCPSSCFPNIQFLEHGLDGLFKRNTNSSSNYGIILFISLGWSIQFVNWLSKPR
jgi:hypothetical protein